MRHEAAAKMLALVQKLCASRNGKTLKALEKELQIHQRTLRRYIKSMQEHNFCPIYTEARNGTTVYKVVESWRDLPPVSMTAEEALALIMARRLLKSQPGTSSLDTALDTLLRKLSSGDAQFSRRVGRMDDLIVGSAMGSGMGPSEIPHYQEVEKAIEKGTKIRFDYTNRAGETSAGRLVAPFAFQISEGVVHLVGHCYKHDTQRNFVAHRMENVECTDVQVTEKFEFDSEEFARHTIGGFLSDPEMVKLRINEHMAEYFERAPAHPDQKVYKHGGDWYLEFEVGVNWALVWWISRYGPNIEVMEPESLREQVADFLRAAAAQYD